MNKVVIHIEKVDCPTEEGLIKNRLKSVDGIDALQFNLMSRELTVTHHLDDAGPIMSALDDIGMEPRLDAPAGSTRGEDHDHDDHDGHDHAHEEGHAHDDGHDHAAHKSRGTEGRKSLERVLLGVAGVCAFAAEGVAWRTGEEAASSSSPSPSSRLFSPGGRPRRRGSSRSRRAP